MADGLINASAAPDSSPAEDVGKQRGSGAISQFLQLLPELLKWKSRRTAFSWLIFLWLLLHSKIQDVS